MVLLHTDSDSSSIPKAFIVAKRASPWWQPLRRLSSDKTVDEQYLEPVAAEYARALQLERGPLTGIPAQTRQASKYLYSSGGAVVCPGVVPVTSELVHVSPYVQHDDDAQRLVIFFGFLSNLGDLVKTDPYTLASRGGDAGAAAIVSPRAASHKAAWLAGGAQTADARGEHAAYMTTCALLQLYDRLGPGQEMLMLSELQGQFAFVILDGNKKVVFAARDASGEEDLYWCAGDDGCVLFTNELDSLPDDIARQHWQALQPGHYMAGKDPTPVQYALSRDELAARERRESCTDGALDDMHLDVRTSGSLGSAGSVEGTSPAALLLRRLSRPFTIS